MRLVLDEMRSSIPLQLTGGRKTRKVFEVYGCYGEKIEKRDSEGSTTCSYAPTLRFAATDGPLEKLAEWPDAECPGVCGVVE